MPVHLGMEFLSSVIEQHPNSSTVSNASPAVLTPVLSAEAPNSALFLVSQGSEQKSQQSCLHKKEF